MKKAVFAYFDTSAWLKIYVREEGCDEARDLARRHHLFSSGILLTEAFSALRRKREAREISDAVLRRLVGVMREDVSAIEIIHPGAEVLARSQEVVLATAARTLDAIHIASALVLQSRAELSLTFVTADRRQLDAARGQGLATHFV